MIMALLFSFYTMEIINSFLLLLFPSPKWYLVYLHFNSRKNQYGDRIAQDQPIMSSELPVSFTIGKC